MTKKPQPHTLVSLRTVLTCLCAFAIQSLPSVGDAQVMPLGMINGEAPINGEAGAEDITELGKSVLMVNGQAFAYGIHGGAAHLFRWSIGQTGFEADAGGSPMTATRVMVGRHQGAAVMAFGNHITIYYNSDDDEGMWTSGVLMTRGPGNGLLPIGAMVRRTTEDGGSFPLRAIGRANTEEYLIDVRDQSVTLAPERIFDRPVSFVTPNIIRTADCLLVALGDGLTCLSDGGSTAVAVGAADITQIDASDTHIAVLADTTAYLAFSSDPGGADPLMRTGINTLVLSESRFAIASDTQVEVFLYQNSEWCLEDTIDTDGVASMDFSEGEVELLLGIPEDARLEAYGLMPPMDARCEDDREEDAGPMPDAGGGTDGGVLDSDAGPGFDGGAGFDAGDPVERAELSCTCRVGTQSPSPFALISGALCLGVLLRRRR